MNKIDRGRRHLCPECAISYYDLKKDVVTCPKCGAKPATVSRLKSGGPVRKASRSTFGRYS